MSYKNVFISVAVVILGFAANQPASASYDDLIGYPELEAMLGGSTPTGAGVEVTQVEALEGSDYLPDINHSEFVGKSFTDGGIVKCCG